ncbi:hypothetical protein Cst_c15040 [Thermoclostridium stercorarium subsp. stercorarium DSM 8532]|jgi:hypothetical protein|uniref:Uncharacterized protein n=1 Tax=Thermoclostridium stercorarium (strain ATCC 35414 / DSM 8532 / NCIMB 11754) TaxID=1121335 RepID=L7VSE8_THES1|nr:hypothetical protein [Thermoclostridium stercorarium]AGC68493.1 hypothetical protein Cst_c15040 [Thermoclostridium stercorarium subsp. stercorarium DSM 8532]AGI39511.1 hypothetical protein Clst_1452 [Thermoclostridium stercorarium subsp. stercorarium DSM 8532]UZQ84480.1 hypothetical protein ODU73_001497 [Thermoclostridium stercorarium]
MNHGKVKWWKIVLIVLSILIPAAAVTAALIYLRKDSGKDFKVSL